MSSYEELRDKLRRKAQQQIENGVNAHLPAGIRLSLGERNPADGDDEEGDDEEDDDEEGECVGSLVFETTDPEDNLACAAAAYRVAGADGDLVALHSSGPAFFGTEDDLDEYTQAHGLHDDGWEVYDDAKEIMDLEYDHDTLKAVVAMMEEREESFTAAKDFHRKFHWDSAGKGNVAVVKQIPGVHGTLCHLGVARRIDYGAEKGDEGWSEFYHHFGEKTGVFPQVYAIMPENGGNPTCLIVHGANMRIEDRGIVE